jgi:uncharacterized protein with PhoU and TrkA domain
MWRGTIFSVFLALMESAMPNLTEWKQVKRYIKGVRHLLTEATKGLDEAKRQPALLALNQAIEEINIAKRLIVEDAKFDEVIEQLAHSSSKALFKQSTVRQCTQCGYTSNIKGDMARHRKSKHSH